ncbi:hypothetical protein CRENBAI_016286 [Crenichthys baileyi]|uniref:Macro domain-containing protein n=1 Tax=Crenichthys baileyi TaxID=28760 RepID=A0AAV9RTG4_9TELE
MHICNVQAFPCISTGIYGYPNEPAADIALKTVKQWIEDNSDKITRVIFCVFLETDFAIYKKKMAILFEDNDIEVTEEQPKGDSTPPSTTSTTKEETEDSEKGNKEAGDEKGNDDEAGNEDVDMASQPADEPSTNMELEPEQNDDEHEKPDEDKVMAAADTEDDNKEMDTGKDEDNKAAQVQPAAEEDNDPTKTSMEGEGASEPNAATSNGEDIKTVESSEEPASLNIPEDSKPKDSAENE